MFRELRGHHGTRRRDRFDFGIGRELSPDEPGELVQPRIRFRFARGISARSLDPAEVPLLVALLLAAPCSLQAAEPNRLEPADVFELEYASDPRISPDGERVVYVRNFMDVMTDRRRSNLWIVDVESEDHRPLTSGEDNPTSPRWSPSGDRLLYASNAGGSSQLWMRWMDTGQSAKLTRLERGAADLAWSPDGRWIAFSAFVPEESEPFVQMPKKPDGAEWAPGAKVIDNFEYRHDGGGYAEDGHAQLFVIAADGGTPRQLTFDHRDHDAPCWMPDGSALVFHANDDEIGSPQDTDLYRLTLADGTIEQLTDRFGPDSNPRVSPDGEWISYTGYDDRKQGYQVTALWVMKADGSAPRCLTAELDRSVGNVRWGHARTLYFSYADRGDTRIGTIALDGGEVRAPIGGGVGGTSLGRPYASGSFTVARAPSGSSPGARVAFTRTAADRPADVAVHGLDGGDRVLTRLNDDLLGHKRLAAVEELWTESAHDGLPIQAWIAKPPGFDPEQRYPLILEIHGGPFANYGPRFAAEIQLYAAAGYVVVYANPRGSTSYGEAFGNAIHHAYPGHDYDDLMSVVDAVIARGWVDSERLFVTGGSGGGVLTSWIVGTTDRFRAAVVAKPVIHWTSFVLTADAYSFFTQYWFPGLPWDHHEHYWQRSPLARVGNVTTPTMLLCGEEDYRTPISEAEQFYQALKLRGVESVFVRLPGSSHGIASRPSRLISKVDHVLAWFEKHRPGNGGEEADGDDADDDDAEPAR